MRRWYTHDTPTGFSVQEPGHVMQQAASYWWQVTKIAFAKTAEFLGWGHVARWPASFLAVCIAGAIYWWLVGDTRVPAEKMIWAVYLMAGAGTVFLAVFAFMVLATPPRLAAEATAEFHRTISGLDSRITELSAISNGQGRGVLTKINELIGETNAILETLRKAESDSDYFKIQNHVDDWEKRASGFVSQEFPDYAALFVSDAGLDNGTVYRGNPKASRLRKRLEFRVVRLKQLLDAHKANPRKPSWEPEDGV